MPIRTCIGCRTTRPASKLVRVAREPSGNIVIGRTIPGRGAWLCDSVSCLEAAVKKKAFSRAFRSAQPNSALQRLREEWGRK